jgi:hypothetical protein
MFAHFFFWLFIQLIAFQFLNESLNKFIFFFNKKTKSRLAITPQSQKNKMLKEEAINLSNMSLKPLETVKDVQAQSTIDSKKSKVLKEIEQSKPDHEQRTLAIEVNFFFFF